MRNKIKYLVTLIIIVISINACATYSPAPYNTVKVLAVTAEGDTIQLDVNSLRPRVYQNIYYSDPHYYNRPFPYYNGWNSQIWNYNKPQVIIKPNINRPKPNNSGTGPNISSPVLTKPTPSSNNKIN